MQTNLARYIQEMNTMAEKVATSVKPAMDAHVRFINSPAFQNMLDASAKQAEIVSKLYKATEWEKIVAQQLAAEAAVRKAFANIDTSGLGFYRKFLQDNFYDEDHNVDIDQASRTELCEVEETIDEFQKQAEQQADKKSLEVIKEVKQELDLRSGKKFNVLFSPKHELIVVGHNDTKPVKFKSKKLLKLLAELAGTNKFTETKILKKEAGYASESAVQNAITTLRDKFAEMGFVNDDPIEGKQGHGYVMHRDICLSYNYNAPD